MKGANTESPNKKDKISEFGAYLGDRTNTPKSNNGSSSKFFG